MSGVQGDDVAVGIGECGQVATGSVQGIVGGVLKGADVVVGEKCGGGEQVGLAAHHGLALMLEYFENDQGILSVGGEFLMGAILNGQANKEEREPSKSCNEQDDGQEELRTQAEV
jgi:hypothetical protein